MICCLLWRLLRVGVPASRNVHAYDCCPEQYIDVTFKIHIRRRMLYYLWNLVLPCFFLSGLSLMVFIMPPDSGEKVTCGTFIPPPQPEPTICVAWLRIEWQHPAVSRLQCFTRMSSTNIVFTFLPVNLFLAKHGEIEQTVKIRPRILHRFLLVSNDCHNMLPSRGFTVRYFYVRLQ